MFGDRIISVVKKESQLFAILTDKIHGMIHMVLILSEYCIQMM